MAESPGANAVFRRVFDEHQDAVHRYCLRRLDVEDANDATAEVLMVAWRRLGEVPDEPDTLMWLYGVARNVVRNQHRSRRRKAGLAARLNSLAHPPIEEPATLVVRHSQVLEVQDAIAGLRDTDRELVRLKMWEELTNEHRPDPRHLG